MIIGEITGEAATPDTLIGVLMVVLMRGRLRSLPSTVAFAEDFGNPADNNVSKESYMLTSVKAALDCVMKIRPDERHVRCKLSSDQVPTTLVDHVTTEEYHELLAPLRKLVTGTEYGEMRKRSAKICCGFGLALAVPFTMIPVVGWGVAAALTATAGSVGLFAGATVPLGRSKVFHELETCVNQINTVLAPRGIALQDPYVTNNLGLSSSIKDVDHIEWIVYSSPQVPS